MDITFLGICCLIDAKASQGGKIVVIPNALRGGMYKEKSIPPHTAFIHAKGHQVDTRGWPAQIRKGDNSLFRLYGDYISFDPKPSGGSINIAALPHVKVDAHKKPICKAADELRAGIVDRPNPNNVLGLVHLPADAHVTTGATGMGAVYAVLHIDAAPVTIIATPFMSGPVRSMTFEDPQASIVIANVTLGDYLSGVSAHEDNHRYLICNIFQPAAAVVSPAVPQLDSQMSYAELSSPETIPHPFDEVDMETLESANGRPLEDFLSTFTAGCSASQWP